MAENYRPRGAPNFVRLLMRKVVFGGRLFRRLGIGRRRGHRVFRIEEVIVVWPQSEFDQGSGIWSGLRLPSLIGLVALHGGLGGGCPTPGWLALHVVLADQSSLNFRARDPNQLPAGRVSSGTFLLCEVLLPA